MTNEKKEIEKRIVGAAKAILKKGDRVRCSKCPGTERTFTFEGWDGEWMVSKSGICDFHPVNITKINGRTINQFK
jgi:hypothetical protein